MSYHVSAEQRQFEQRISRGHVNLDYVLFEKTIISTPAILTGEE